MYNIYINLPIIINLTEKLKKPNFPHEVSFPPFLKVNKTNSMSHKEQFNPKSNKFKYINNFKAT